MAIFTGTAGADTFIGSTADDVFRFTPATLQPGDVAIGGGGFDTLQFTAGGSIAAVALAGISDIDRVLFSTAGNALTLAAALVASAGGLLEVRGNAGNDLLDAAALTDPTLRVSFLTGVGGADTLIGGAGNDSATIQATGTRLFQLGGGNDSVTAGFDMIGAADTIQGGAGIDRLTFNTSGAVLAASLVGLSSIEEIALPNLAGMSLQVSDAMMLQAGGVLKVIGSAATQSVDASGVGSGFRSVYFAAASGGDSFLGGFGADTFEAADAGSGDLGGGNDLLRLTSTLAGAASVAGGTGHDTILLTRGGDWLLGPALTGFEEVEITANGTRLTLNATPGLEVIGSGFNDRVELGAAGQTFFGFEGNDTAVVTAAMLAGIVLNGGGQTTRDTLILDGDGTFDLRRAFITGFERIEVTPDFGSTVRLAAQPLDVVLRGPATVHLGAHAAQSLLGSPIQETAVLGAAGQVVAMRGGNDLIQATAAQLAAGTMIDGGGASDRLDILGGGTVDLATGALVQNVEWITLQLATDLTLDAAPAMQVTGSAGADTIRASLGDLTGDLGGGNDLVEILSTTLVAAPGTLSLGGGTDTLRVLQGTFQGSFTIPARFTDAEVLDLQPIVFSTVITIAGSQQRTILMPTSANAFVVGGDGNEVFQFGAAGGNGDAGGGADTMLGGAGSDNMIGGAGNDSLSGGGAHDSLDGGLGADTLDGGAGNDAFFIDGNAELADWALHSRTVIGAPPGQGASQTDTLIVSDASGNQTLDLGQHTIIDVDLIRIGSGVNLTLVISDAMASTAQALGTPGVVEVSDFFFSPGNLVIDASALTATRRLATSGVLNGADSILGGAGGDLISGASGNDTVKGGGGEDSIGGGNGNDELRGEAGADSIVGGAGMDSIWGDAGGDTLDGGAGDNASDRFAYNSSTNGTADIDTTQALNTADLIRNFTPRANAGDTVGDWLAMSAAGLGLNGGANEIVLASNEAWDATLYSIFVMHSLDTLGNSGTAGGTDFTNLTQIAAGVNLDGGAKVGFVAGRTVVFAMSNGESLATRQTGIYRWTDDGDGLLEAAGDDVRLLAIIDGASTQNFSVDTIVIA
jgi:Ca2+-binding RTX toxin-like protein